MEVIMKIFHKRFLSILLTLAILCCSIFSFSLPVSAASACYLGSNYLGTFTFNGNNTGANRTIYGNRMRFCIAHKAGDSNPYYYNLFVACYRWDSVEMKHVYLQNYGSSPDSDGYYFYVSDWFDISYGVDYHLSYSANTFGVGYEPRVVNIHAWFDVE